jgi:hypothetical protein
MTGNKNSIKRAYKRLFEFFELFQQNALTIDQYNSFPNSAK